MRKSIQMSNSPSSARICERPGVQQHERPSRWRSGAAAPPAAGRRRRPRPGPAARRRTPARPAARCRPTGRSGGDTHRDAAQHERHRQPDRPAHALELAALQPARIAAGQVERAAAMRWPSTISAPEHEEQGRIDDRHDGPRIEAAPASQLGRCCSGGHAHVAQLLDLVGRPHRRPRAEHLATRSSSRRTPARPPTAASRAAAPRRSRDAARDRAPWPRPSAARAPRSVRKKMSACRGRERRSRAAQRPRVPPPRRWRRDPRSRCTASGTAAASAQQGRAAARATADA